MFFVRWRRSVSLSKQFSSAAKAFTNFTFKIAEKMIPGQQNVGTPFQYTNPNCQNSGQQFQPMIPTALGIQPVSSVIHGTPSAGTFQPTFSTVPQHFVSHPFGMGQLNGAYQMPGAYQNSSSASQQIVVPPNQMPPPYQNASHVHQHHQFVSPATNQMPGNFQNASFAQLFVPSAQVSNNLQHAQHNNQSFSQLAPALRANNNQMITHAMVAPQNADNSQNFQPSNWSNHLPGTQQNVGTHLSSNFQPQQQQNCQNLQPTNLSNHLPGIHQNVGTHLSTNFQSQQQQNCQNLEQSRQLSEQMVVPGLSENGTTSFDFMVKSVSNFNQILPPIQLFVSSLDFREAQLTPNGPMRVCNAILINGEGKTVEVSAWRLQADVLASVMRGCLYIFVNCRAKPPRERTNCWFRLNIDAMSSYLVQVQRSQIVNPGPNLVVIQSQQNENSVPITQSAPSNPLAHDQTLVPTRQNSHTDEIVEVERNESARQANRQQQVRRSNVEHGRVRHGGDDPTEPVRNHPYRRPARAQEPVLDERTSTSGGTGFTRPERQSRQSVRPSVEPTLSSVVEPPPPPGPYPLSKIKRLPTCQINQSHINEGIECSICGELFVMDSIVSALQCTHLYHQNCIKKWLKISGACPLCKIALD